MPYAERIAWLASRKAGLEYSLDVHDPVHDPVLRLASAALPPGHPVYAITVAAIIEMVLLNCTHAVAQRVAFSAMSTASRGRQAPARCR